MTSYSSHTGILELQHAYLALRASPVLASVDVNLLVENIKREDLEVGAWVNIIGYLGRVLAEGENGNTGRKQPEKIGDQVIGVETKLVKVEVQAIMLWSAGAIKIADYEMALEERLKST